MAILYHIFSIFYNGVFVIRTQDLFEPTRKRRKGYPSEMAVKRGVRVVHGDKDLREKLGKDDLCPCGFGRRFQAMLP